MLLFLINQKSGNPGLTWQDFLSRVGQEIPIQRAVESPPSLELEKSMIILLGWSNWKMCQVFICPSGLILLSMATFKALARGECV